MASKITNLRFLLQPQILNKTTKLNQSTLPPHLRAAYEKFQREDGVPVYLKGGVGDRLLLGLTVVLIAAGLCNAMYTLARLDRKK